MGDAPNTVEAYVTRYAMTDGIERLQGRVTNGMFVAKNKDGYDNYYHGEGRDWHHTLDGAIARAEKMRSAKIKSHEKSIAKLKALDFAARDREHP